MTTAAALGRPAAAETPHGAFVADLTSVEDEIIVRNKRWPDAYRYLQPSLIPNSTNI